MFPKLGVRADICDKRNYALVAQSTEYMYRSLLFRDWQCSLRSLVEITLALPLHRCRTWPGFARASALPNQGRRYLLELAIMIRRAIVKHTPALAQLLDGLMQRSPAHLANLFSALNLILALLLHVTLQAAGVLPGCRDNAEPSARA